jgi:hypothetical protein
VSAISSEELNERLHSMAVAYQLGGGSPTARRYFDAVEKAPRLVLAWHFVRIAWDALCGRPL